MNVSDILAAARRADTRTDSHAHVADLYGCDRATWYRRNGYEAEPLDDATLRKFDVGHAVEAQIASRLSEAGEHVVCGLGVALRVEAYGLDGRNLRMNEETEADEVVGHPDLDLPDHDTLIEVKTTDVRRVADEASPHYALQAAAYALALGRKRAVVHVTHTALYGKDEAEYEIDPEQYRARVALRVAEVVELTAPGSPMPDAEPAAESAAFACRYCRWSQCSRNPEHVA